MVIGLLPLLWVPQAGLPTTDLTYQTVGKPVGKVVQELSSILKVKLEATAQTRQEVVVVSADHVPANQLLERIATATGSEWHSLGGGFRLVANRSQRQKDARIERAYLTSLFQQSLAHQLKSFEKTKKARVNSNDSSDATDDSPETVARILATLDAQTLGNLETGDRLVYSDNPTAMQGQLPPSALNLIRNWYATNRQAISISGTRSETVPVDGQAKPNEPIGTALLVVEGSTDGSVSAQLNLYGTNGKTLRNLNFGLSSTEAPEEEKPALKSSSTPVEYSQESEALMAFSSNTSVAENGFSMPENVQNFLGDPEARDPLSFMISDDLISWAKFLHKPLVADVPDRASDLATTNLSKLTVEEFDQFLKSGATLKTTENSDWLVVRPTTPERARLRIDRSAISRLIRESSKQGFATLDELAQYAKTSPLVATDGFEAMELFLFVPGFLGLQSEMENGWLMVRFYGTLTTGQYNQLQTEGRLSFEQLSDEQKQLISRLVYQSPRLSFHDGTPTAPLGDGIADNVLFGQTRADIDTTDLRSEPTYSFPNGLPYQGSIEFKTQQETVVKLDDKRAGLMGMFSVVGPDELSMLRLQETRPEAVFPGVKPNLDRLLPGTRTQLNFTFRLAPAITQEGQLHDDLFDQGKFLTYDQLPADFLARVAKATERFKKYYDQSTRNGEGTIPPR